jgi:hypothetical protein
MRHLGTENSTNLSLRSGPCQAHVGKPSHRIGVQGIVGYLVRRGMAGSTSRCWFHPLGRDQPAFEGLRRVTHKVLRVVIEHKNVQLYASGRCTQFRGVKFFAASLTCQPNFPVFPILPRNLASGLFKLQLLENSTFTKPAIAISTASTSIRDESRHQRRSM